MAPCTATAWLRSTPPFSSSQSSHASVVAARPLSKDLIPITQHQGRDKVDVLGLLGVGNGFLRLAIRFPPAGGAAAELRGMPGVATVQLGPQELLEEMVVAVPLPLMIERQDEAVGALQRLQSLGRSLRLEDRVTERAGQTRENGRPCQEAKLLGEKLSSSSDLRYSATNRSPPRKSPALFAPGPDDRIERAAR